MAGKGVAKGMRGGAFVDAGEFDGGFDGFLRVRFVQMKASEFVWRGWQARQFNRRKEPLPHPFFGGMRIFLLKRMRQKDSGDVVLRPLLLMPRFELFDVRQQFRDDSLRQRHGAIFLAFAVMHGQDAGVEIQAMDAEIQTFEQAQAAAVEQLDDERVRRGQLRENGVNFRARQHDRNAPFPLGAHDAAHVAEFFPQDMAKEEEQGVEGLILAGRRDAPIDG